jgi:hypothetical protein
MLLFSEMQQLRKRRTTSSDTDGAKHALFVHQKPETHTETYVTSGYDVVHSTKSSDRRRIVHVVLVLQKRYYCYKKNFVAASFCRTCMYIHGKGRDAYLSLTILVTGLMRKSPTGLSQVSWMCRALLVLSTPNPKPGRELLRAI